MQSERPFCVDLEVLTDHVLLLGAEEDTGDPREQHWRTIIKGIDLKYFDVSTELLLVSICYN